MSGLGFFSGSMEVHPLLVALIVIVVILEIVWLIKKREREKITSYIVL